MTATDELRRLLDERGVEYATDDNDTSNDTMWTTQNGGWVFDCDYMEPLNAKPGTVGAKTELMIYGYTPEQAVAATLERGECVMHPIEWYGQPAVYYSCSECDTSIYDPHPNYCPCCGRRVKGGEE